MATVSIHLPAWDSRKSCLTKKGEHLLLIIDNFSKTAASFDVSEIENLILG